MTSSILSALVGPKLILLSTTEGWSAQHYSIIFDHHLKGGVDTEGVVLALLDDGRDLVDGVVRPRVLQLLPRALFLGVVASSLPEHFHGQGVGCAVGELDVDLEESRVSSPVFKSSLT